MELLTSDEQIPLLEQQKEYLRQQQQQQQQSQPPELIPQPNDYDPADFDPTKCTFYTRRYRYSRKARLERIQCIFCTVLLSSLFILFFGTAIYSVRSGDESDTADDQPLLLLAQFVQFYELPHAAHEYVSLAFRNIHALERNLSPISYSSPIFKHQIATFTSRKANRLARFGLVEQLLAKFLKQNKIMPEMDTFCPNYTKYWPEMMEKCAENVHLKCTGAKGGVIDAADADGGKYRTFNGSCNNLRYPNKFGVAFTPFRRVLAASYANGVDEPRRSVDGGELPLARNVSLFVHRPSYKSDVRFTVMFAVFGQFLDHDITATALSQTFEGKPISCCEQESSNGEPPHPNCFPIRVTKTDPYYLNYNITCVDFSRSATALTCCLGRREQLNQASSFLDGSVVYSSETVFAAQRLRENRNGRLRMLNYGGRQLLPVSQDANDGCNRAEMGRIGRYCFETGDGRANENLHLTTLHLIWARHHNYLADNLRAVNPNWSDEKLFQEARRILVAQLQHIAYNEFLPILFGSELMRDHGLRSQTSGYFHMYDDRLDPSVANNFAAASFRFAHTLIPGLIKMINKHQNSSEDVELHRILFNPYKLYDDRGIDSIILGALQTHLEESDTLFSNELKNRLFEPTTDADPARFAAKKSNKTAEEIPFFKPCGLDLVTLNIQRGRDHGLPAYPYWREYCGYSRPRTFRDLRDIFDADSLRLIAKIYRHVDDIDLYTGALSEIVTAARAETEGGLLGATLNCLLVDQFRRLKFADRYWYETPMSPQAFSLRQLDSIRRTTKLSTIFCDNSDHIERLSLFVMQQRSDLNPSVDCVRLPRLNFTLWADDTVESDANVDEADDFGL